MTTLSKTEVVKYLNHLKSETKKRISSEEKADLKNLAYQQMYDLLNAEIEFLKYMNPHEKSEPRLAISLNGLPSVASLNADLEKMCEISGEEPMFTDIAEKFKNGKEKTDSKIKKELYKEINEEEWQETLKKYQKGNLVHKIGFKISENHEEKFQIRVVEEIRVPGYDKYAKEFPILIREAESIYTVMWSQLLDKLDEKFYVPNVSSSLEGGKKLIEKPKIVNRKTFKDVEKNYIFSRKNYPEGKIPLVKQTHWIPKDYSQFLEAGYFSRVKTTNDILKILDPVFGDIKITLEKNRSSETEEEEVLEKGGSLEEFLGFENILFENAPDETPELNNLEIFQTKINLIQSSSGEKIGKINYILPHKKAHYTKERKYLKKAHRRDDKYRGEKINFGEIKVAISANHVKKKAQLQELQQKLNKIDTAADLPY